MTIHNSLECGVDGRKQQKLILWASASLTDNVLLTGVVRELQLHHPDRYRIDVRTPLPELWEGQPDLAALDARDPGVRVVNCHGPFPTRAGQSRLEAMCERVNQEAATRLRPALPGGTVVLRAEERAGPSSFSRRTGLEVPYWLVAAGGDYRMSAAWWHFRRMQAVVDHFRDRLLFVQVGRDGDYHPPLAGVICWRAQTTLRELVRLIHQADGVLCLADGLMHLAAAVELPKDRDWPRPCVVVAGGRGSPQHEGYPFHQFIHTVGSLSCCAQQGCGRMRTVGLGDGAAADRAEHLCVEVTEGMPRCMSMIEPEEVIRRIEYYLRGGRSRILSPAQARLTQASVRPSQREQLLSGPRT